MQAVDAVARAFITTIEFDNCIRSSTIKPKYGLPFFYSCRYIVLIVVLVYTKTLSKSTFSF